MYMFLKFFIDAYCFMLNNKLTEFVIKLAV